MSKEALISNHRRAIAGISLGLLTTVAACSSHETDKPAPRAEASTSTRHAKTAELVFDDLGAGSSVIRVFPGVSRSARDRVANGTYLDDQRAMAECKVEGREVSSDTSIGEVARQSKEWIFFRDDNKVGHYATAVYVQQPERLLATLDDC